MFGLLKELLESTIGDVLLHAPEYNAIKQAAPEFAKKLATAWDGDIKDYKRTHGKNVDLLFPKMLTPEALGKFMPGVELTSALKQKIDGLKQIQKKAFPFVAAGAKVDVGVWKDERWAKESKNLDTDYEMLREELNSLYESKMSQLDADIRALFRASNQDIVKIEKPSIHTFKNVSGNRKFIVHPIVFTKKQSTQKYQDYVYHEEGSTDIKRGLPKKRGGDIVSVK